MRYGWTITGIWMCTRPFLVELAWAASIRYSLIQDPSLRWLVVYLGQLVFELVKYLGDLVIGLVKYLGDSVINLVKYLAESLRDFAIDLTKFPTTWSNTFATSSR